MFYLHDEPRGLRFELVAQLSREELKDLEGSWKTAESIRSGRPMLIDTRRLASVGEPTRLLLERLQAVGATILERTSEDDHRRWVVLNNPLRWFRQPSLRASG